jgi:hypothetical protein
MSEQMLELESQIERLESRLATARSDLQRIKEKSQRARSATPVALALVAASMMIAAGELPHKVKAPFQVLDSDDKKIFQVGDQPWEPFRGFKLYDQQQIPVLTGSVSQTGSSFKAGYRTIHTVMGVVEGGQTPALAMRYNSEKTPRLAIAVVKGKPSLEMRSHDDVGIVQVTQGDAGGGALLLADGKGEARVLFGVTPKNAGKVIAYPNTLAGGAMSKLYSSMICGLAGCQ